MSKRAPSTAQLLLITGFALSCFGILLFLWVTFGGPTPFRAKPYEVKIPFSEATQLAEQSDVRISGVNVGKVQSIELAPNGKQALATVDIEDRYAPIPRSTRAMLRTKTLLGETYVELTPGNGGGPQLKDGGTLAEANVAQSVQLDEIFRTFNPETRAAFQHWMQEAAVAINGQGQGLSYGIGELEPTFGEYDRLFRALDTQRLAVHQLFKSGATAFSALRGREGQLANLIRSSNAVFSTTARRDRDIEALFRAFPTFLDESRATVSRLRGFAVNADPLMRQLVPAAEQLSPTLVAIGKLAPESKAFFEGLEPVIERAPAGFGAFRRLFRNEFPPLLRAIEPFARNLNPILVGLKLYKHEITAAFGNIASASNAITTEENEQGEHLHFLRTEGMMNPESVATYLNRLTANRNSPYSPPLWAKGLAGGLPSFDTRQCTTGITVSLDPETPKNPAFQERVKPKEHKSAETTNPAYKEAQTVEEAATELFEHIKQYAFAGQTSTASLPAPPCKQQGPFEPIYGSGSSTQYQHTFEQPRP